MGSGVCLSVCPGAKSGTCHAGADVGASERVNFFYQNLTNSDEQTQLNQVCFMSKDV